MSAIAEKKKIKKNMSVAYLCHSWKKKFKKDIKGRRPMCAIDQGALRCPCKCEIQYGGSMDQKHRLERWHRFKEPPS